MAIDEEARSDESVERTCVDCRVLRCSKPEGRYPGFCVSESLDEDWVEEVKELYEEEENNRIAVTAATVESDFYGIKTRVEETIEFAKRLGVKKVGIATCVGLIRESNVLATLLRENGFEVFGAGCKIGTVRKVDIGAPERCETTGAIMCNPIAQAKLLAKEGTELNIVVGLCVGHDSLFYKYSEAITTTLVVKDRVLVHNPVAALYAANGFYAKKLHVQKD